MPRRIAEQRILRFADDHPTNEDLFVGTPIAAQLQDDTRLYKIELGF